MNFFNIRIIVPTIISMGAIVDEITDQLGTEEKKVQELYEKTVRTWSNRPQFITTRKIGSDIEVTVRPDDTKGGDIHRYLDFGIKDRRAVMADGFAHKSRVNMVGSYPAGGRRIPIFISKKPIGKSIAARNWTELITKRREHAFQWNMDLAIRRGSKKLFLG